MGARPPGVGGPCVGIPGPGHALWATLHLLFKRLDREAFEQALGAWLREQGVAPEEALAVDGKTLRGIHGEQLPRVHLKVRGG
jgi:hypothetical protein